MTCLSDEKIKELADGWIPDNLHKFGNSVVPTSVVEDFGKRQVEEWLTAAMGKPVELVQSDYGWTAWICWG